MKIFIGDLSALKVASGPRVRFSVTHVDSDGEPVVTYKGWTMDQKRRIAPPAARAHSGGYFRFSDVSEKFADGLRKILTTDPTLSRIVESVLGPEAGEGMTYEGNEKFEGSAEAEL